MRVALLLLLAGCAAPRLERLPADFSWGVATSGFQSEGSFPDSNWTRYARRAGHEPYRDSVDFYRRFDDDVALAAGLGINTFRFSIEWARVMPARGVVDEAALAHYDALFAALERHHLVPMVTLCHFVVPGWVLDEGGLGDDRIVGAFADFARVVAGRYGARVGWWVTLNEASYFLTLERRHGSVSDAQVEAAKERLVQMHRVAWEALHAVDPNARVSTNVVFEPAPASWFDDWYFDRVKDRLEWLALDYYYSLSPELSVVHAAKGQFWRVRFTPDALVTALLDYHRRAPHLPVYVVENGMATDDGLPRRDGMTRSRHLVEHVRALQQARALGVPVVGYNYWSLTDNYEWGDYRNRFGLYTVDVRFDPTLRRKPTDGVATFQKLIREGGVR